MKKGYCQLYYGDGKGKTSILNGMVLRAMGCGLKIKYFRFMKNWPTGELKLFQQIKLPLADFYFSSTKFFWDMNDVERRAVKKEVVTGLQALTADVNSGKYDMILIDELFSCLDNELISCEDIINLIKGKHPGTELVFSAHEVDEFFFPYFDLISRVCKKKHYYETIKLLARKGVEF